jgi:hypothetical protein
MKGEVYNIIGLDRWETLNEAEKVATWDAMKLNGAIIGEVTIIDCVQDHSSLWADQGLYQWVLSDPVLYDKPIVGVKGMLGLWNYELPFKVTGSAEMVEI